MRRAAWGASIGVGGIFGAVMLWSLPIAAADPDGNFTLRGVGAQSCAAFLHDVSATANAAEAEGAATEDGAAAAARLMIVRGWIDGYVSAYNRLTPGVYDALPLFTANDVLRFLISGCPGSPDMALGTALSSVLSSLAGTRLTVRPIMESVGTGDQAVEVPQEMIRNAQRSLSALGLYQGGIDGQYGPGTAAGVRAFQEANGLPVTGTFDQSTLAALLVPTTVAEAPPAAEQAPAQ